MDSENFASTRLWHATAKIRDALKIFYKEFSNKQSRDNISLLQALQKWIIILSTTASTEN